jgi:hypothetical protein
MRILMIAATLAGTGTMVAILLLSPAKAEEVCVKYHKCLDIDQFKCETITRSSFINSGVLSRSQAVYDYQAEGHLLSSLQCEARDNDGVFGSAIDGQLLQQKHQIKAGWCARPLRLPGSSDSYPLARRQYGPFERRRGRDGGIRKELAAGMRRRDVSDVRPAV